MSIAPTPINFGQKEEAKKEKEYNFDHGKLIDLTDEAIEKVKDFAIKNPATKGKTFRVYVEGGGCSGFQYGFTFDDKKDDDQIVKCADLEVLVDEQSKIYLQGSVVDYVDGFSGAGFIVKNPQAKATCGCGTSFTV